MTVTGTVEYVGWAIGHPAGTYVDETTKEIVSPGPPTVW
jgi:hypothetical protein